MKPGPKRYNPRKRMSIGMMHSFRGLVAAVGSLLVVVAQAGAQAQGRWEQPAQALAEKIGDVLGPAQARLVIHNNSTIAMDEVPVIRRLLEQDLKTRGVLASGAESANTIRVTLSENVRERLWVAEMVEGNQTRVAMVHVDPAAPLATATHEGTVLHKQIVISERELSDGGSFPLHDPVLALLETTGGLVVLRQAEISVFVMTTAGWKAEKTFALGSRQPLGRDSRGVMVAGPGPAAFVAYVPGTECAGSLAPSEDAGRGSGDWSLHCHASDDPWPIAAGVGDAASSDVPMKAFYNAGRNFFTGVVTPGVGADLEPFYAAALLPRPNGFGFLSNGLDGKVQLAEAGAVKTIAGARDWGSDFAVLTSACGAGTQVIASSSGDAAADSLRAYEIPGLEAVAVSAPLSMDGTVMSLISAPDAKGVLAVVRRSGLAGQADEYAGYRVTATCN
jgi:hypothetical protein